MKDSIDHSPLFEILNYIIEIATEKPEQIKKFYDKIPQEQKKGDYG
jgi:hypothetical protein